MVLTGGPVVAVVPARGGSKGLPGKNIVPFAGRPLVAWSIEAGLAAAGVDRVLVSTDDPAIAEVAVAAGAEVPWLRPPGLALDETLDLAVFAHTLAWLDADGPPPSILVQLRPTSPLRPAGFVDAGIALLVEREADAVRSVSPPPKTPYKMWREADGWLEPLLGSWDEELFNAPRQALPEVWEHDGVLDVIAADTVRAGSMTGRRVASLHTPPGYAVDIDTAEDLARAEQLAARLRRPLA
jgi:CMP-N,N'-diacetyllegionaminic acid synthase